MYNASYLLRGGLPPAEDDWGGSNRLCFVVRDYFKWIRWCGPEPVNFSSEAEFSGHLSHTCLKHEYDFADFE